MGTSVSFDLCTELAMIANDVRRIAIVCPEVPQNVSSVLIVTARRIDLLISSVERMYSDMTDDSLGQCEEGPDDPRGCGEKLPEGSPVPDSDLEQSQRQHRRCERALKAATTAKPKVTRRKRRKKHVRKGGNR